MKKIKHLWIGSLLLLFGAVALTSCSDDDDSGAAASLLAINEQSLDLDKGETFQLTVAPRAEGTELPSIMWSSSVPSVAVVSHTGVVTAMGGGTTVITASSLDGTVSATCEVTVTSYPEGITLSQTDLTVNLGETATLTATVLPKDTKFQGVTWSSADETIATVDQNGQISALKKGTTTINATTDNGEFSASCVLTVNIPVTGVSLSDTELTLNVGDEYTLVANVLPADASNTTVTWSSSDRSIATVTDGVVTALKPGTVTISVLTSDGSYIERCTITINEKNED